MNDAAQDDETEPRRRRFAAPVGRLPVSMATPVLDAGNVRWRRIIVASVLAATLAAGFIGSIAMLAFEIQRVIDAAPMAVPHACVRVVRSGIADARGSSALSIDTTETERSEQRCG
jgi:hypothetical protein